MCGFLLENNKYTYLINVHVITPISSAEKNKTKFIQVFSLYPVPLSTSKYRYFVIFLSFTTSFSYAYRSAISIQG